MKANLITVFFLSCLRALELGDQIRPQRVASHGVNLNAHIDVKGKSL
jgi:hypothetical protein